MHAELLASAGSLLCIQFQVVASFGAKLTLSDRTITTFQTRKTRNGKLDHQLPPFTRPSICFAPFVAGHGTFSHPSPSFPSAANLSNSNISDNKCMSCHWPCPAADTALSVDHQSDRRLKIDHRRPSDEQVSGRIRSSKLFLQ